MAYTVSLTDGTTTYALLDKTNYKALYGMLVDPTDARIQWHVPDHGETRLVDTNNSDRFASIPIHSLGGADTSLNNLINIKRWVDGAESQAARYELLGDVDPIYLKVQRNGSTNATLHRVKHGRVDDSSAHYTPAAAVNNRAATAVINLVLSPYGEAETALTFNQELQNADFLVDDGAGLAANWNAIGTPTTTLDTTIWLINGQSQKVVTDASTSEGINADAETIATAGNAINAFVWLHRSVGSDDITVELLGDVGGSIASVKYDTAGWTSYTDPRGQAWKRVEVSGTAQGGGSPDTTVTLRIYRASGDANEATTFYVDGAYLNDDQNTATVPYAGWTSSQAITNRNDTTNTNLDRINYVDMWGLPGDSPPQIIWNGEISTGDGAAIIAGRQIDGKYTAVVQDHWVEANESTTESGGTTGAWSDGTGTSNNNFSRFTEGGIGNDGGYIEWTFADDVARALLIAPRRVWAIVRASAVSRTSITMSGRINGLNLVPDAPTVQPVVNATWEAMDCGILNLSGVIYGQGVGDADNLSFLLRLTIEDGLNQNDTVDVDALIFMPLSDEYLITEVQTATSIANDEFVIDGTKKVVSYENRVINEPSTAGTLWYATPGPIVNRTIFMNITDTVPGYNIASTINFATIKVTPRTRHLLGTL